MGSLWSTSCKWLIKSFQFFSHSHVSWWWIYHFQTIYDVFHSVFVDDQRSLFWRITKHGSLQSVDVSHFVCSVFVNVHSHNKGKWNIFTCDAPASPAQECCSAVEILLFTLESSLNAPCSLPIFVPLLTSDSTLTRKTQALPVFLHCFLWWFLRAFCKQSLWAIVTIKGS